MKGKHIQFVATFIISVLNFLGAYGLAWSSYALIVMESDQSPLGYKITKQDGNLIGSVVMLGSLLSAIVAQSVTDNIGRKKTIILCGLSATLGWSITTTAKTVIQILIGRFIIGIGMGLHVITALVYINEYCDTSIRGSLTSLITFMYNMGTLVSYTVGWVFSYEFTNYFGVGVAVLFSVASFWLRDSPAYLIGKGMEKQALESLRFYRGKSTITQEIMEEMIYIRNQQYTNNIQMKQNDNEKVDLKTDEESQKLNSEKENRDVNEKQIQQSTWSLLRSSKVSQRALVTVSLLMVLNVFFGMLGVEAYAGQFFSKAAPNLSPHLCSVLLALVVATVSGTSVIIFDLVPRRVLMISTCLLSAACMAVLASLLRWAWAPEWAIPALVVLYCVCYHSGTITLPFVQAGEVFSPQMKSFASSFIMSCMFISNFVLLYIFGPCVQAFGLDGTFMMFSLISLLTAFVAFLFMRETRRVPLEEIQSMFEKGYLYRKH